MGRIRAKNVRPTSSTSLFIIELEITSQCPHQLLSHSFQTDAPSI